MQSATDTVVHFFDETRWSRTLKIVNESENPIPAEAKLTRAKKASKEEKEEQTRAGRKA